MTDPKNVGEVHNFYELPSFYIIFVKDFSTISFPLNKLIKKVVAFVWGEK